MASPPFCPPFVTTATPCGLVPVVVDAELGERLLREIEADPTLVLTVDIDRRTLEVPALGITAEFPLSDSIRHRLLNGLDDIGLTLTHADDIAGYETTRPAWLPTTA